MPMCSYKSRICGLTPAWPKHWLPDGSRSTAGSTISPAATCELGMLIGSSSDHCSTLDRQATAQPDKINVPRGPIPADQIFLEGRLITGPGQIVARDYRNVGNLVRDRRGIRVLFETST